MSIPVLTPDAVDLIRAMRSYGGPEAVSELVDNGVNQTTPRMLLSLLDKVDEWWLHWWNEEDPESPWELNLVLKPGLDLDDGLAIAWACERLFLTNDWDWSARPESQGRVTMRFIGGDN